MNLTQWQSHIDACNRSGLNKRAYADKHSLVYHQFMYRIKQLENKSSSPFIKALVTPQTKPVIPEAVDLTRTPSCLGVIEFPSGARLVINSPELFAHLPSLLNG